jgi:hypothetical protein
MEYLGPEAEVHSGAIMLTGPKKEEEEKEDIITLNKVIIKCTVRYIVHLQCTLSLSLSLSYVRMKVRDSDVLVLVRGKRKMSQVLGAFGLLDFTI